MMEGLKKMARFGWRTSRNLLCVIPVGRRWLFPPQALSERFGRGDADYSIQVFLHHFQQLSGAGFQSAQRILEVGPGRNLGTGLLMWALNRARLGEGVAVVLWDVPPT